MTLKREEYIKYRFKRAEESLEDALILIEKERWNTAINRLYYSCFYAVISLLLKNGFVTRTHDGARTKFGNEYIKTGILDKKYGKIYSKLFDFRQKGDYGDLFDFDDNTVLPLVNQVKEFIASIKELIEK
jgi:uncharacterized protein (UPF0332 family)